MSNITKQYKGWTLELRPEGDYCASFSLKLTSPQGRVKHLNTAGNTEEMAVARGKEIVDAEIELGA
ncbi:hypothetical protein [Paucidesulfovibrio longus]|jgi:hypothetical protein|uniref:hypothetical protein n=1 Tax=Paucidesulfovibrio longus TaxID=889 RepID=UPI0003B495A8|nr:hypothetical protein [Paucidesulfovibrio longus]